MVSRARPDFRAGNTRPAPSTTCAPSSRLREERAASRQVVDIATRVGVTKGSGVARAHSSGRAPRPRRRTERDQSRVRRPAARSAAFRRRPTRGRAKPRQVQDSTHRRCEETGPAPAAPMRHARSVRSSPTARCCGPLALLRRVAPPGLRRTNETPALRLLMLEAQARRVAPRAPRAPIAVYFVETYTPYTASRPPVSCGARDLEHLAARPGRLDRDRLGEPRRVQYAIADRLTGAFYRLSYVQDPGGATRFDGPSVHGSDLHAGGARQAAPRSTRSTSRCARTATAGRALEPKLLVGHSPGRTAVVATPPA